MPGLSASDVVNVQVTLTPLPVPLRNFGTFVIIGPTEGVINIGERLRLYTTITGVAQDFGTTTPEYLAANLFFEQSPQPAMVYIGRWAQSATHAWLNGATLPTSQQVMTVWNPITTGSMSITIDGTIRNLSNLNFSTAANMNGVASIIQGSLPAGATCQWNAVYSRFMIRGIQTGTAGTITYATPTGTGVDISSLTGLSQASGASAPVNGISAETPLQCMTAMVSVSNDWYGAMFAPLNNADINDASYEAVANFIEAQNPSRVFGISTQSATVIDPTQTGDLASVLKSMNLEHTCIHYSSSSPYAIASLFGRAFTVDFTANNSVITLKFKQEPGIVAEFLAESQAQALNNKNCNVFVNYNNGVAIIQQGVMSGGFFFDERQGLDWLQNNVQTKLFNILYTSPTKIPQTDDGIHVLKTGVENALIDGINNGLIAAGVWQSSAVFGQLVQGQFLPKGYYVFAPPVSQQDPAIRAQRIAPTIQAAVKLAGAVHFASCIINVNR
jgi:Protein of unknown function (DUF3383)